MTKERLLELSLTREGAKNFPFLVKVKYSRQAIPIIYGMTSREEAEEFAKDKEERNCLVRWTEVLPKSPSDESCD
jgi:hypothetical protein